MNADRELGIPELVQSEGQTILQVVRARKRCDSTCPVFDSCLVMPLAIKPKNAKDRACMVNAEQHDIRMAYIHLALGGESELVDEIQRHFLGYLKEVNELEAVLQRKGKNFTVKDRLLLLNQRDKIMNRLTSLYRTKYGEKMTVRKEDKSSQPIRLVEITERDVKKKGQLRITKGSVSDEEREEFEKLEQTALAAATPDTDSLVYSAVVKEILPSMMLLPEELAAQAPVPEPAHPIIRQFFEVDEK